MSTELKTTEMLNRDEIPKDNTLIGAAAPPDGTPQPSNDIRKENESRICSDNEQPNPKDSGTTSSLSVADPPTVNTIPYESRCDGISLKLPKEWEERDGWIYSDGKPISNFQILPQNLRIHYSRNGERKLTVRCVLITKDKITEVDIPYNDLQNGKFKKHLPNGFVVFTVWSKQLERLFCNSILQTMADLPNEKTSCLSFGYNIINDRHVFNAGDRLINGSQIDNWKSDSDVRMRYTKPQPHNVYKDLIFSFSRANNYPEALFIATSIPYVLPLVDKDKRERYDFSLYITGNSSSGKTEIAKLFSTPFEGNEHMVSLSSDIEAIHKLSAYKDCTVVIDDLNATDSDEIRRNKEKKLAAIIETKQSVGRAIIDGKNTKIPAMPIITAEYLLKAVGALNRCMIFHIDRPFKPSELTWLQENHDTYIAFINSFIEFICMNFDELQTDVNKFLSTRKYRMKDGENIPGWQRISNIQFILEATLMVVMKFFGDEDDKLGCFPSFWSPFKESIQECKEYTAELLRKRSMDKEELLMYELLSAILDPQSGIVTDNKSSFLRDLDKHKNSLPERFVYYHEDKKLFCLRSEDAVRFLDGKMSNRKIPQKLDDMGLIRTTDSERTIRVFKKDKNIRLICLKQKAVANYLGVENEFLPPHIKDKPYNGCFGQSTTTNSCNYSDITKPDLNEEVYKDFESQMCGHSDDMSDNSILNFIRKCR